jgi:zinc transport system permease protein
MDFLTGYFISMNAMDVITEIVKKMIEIFQYEFMRNAMLTGLLVSIACGIVGTLVVVNRLAFLAGGVAHAAYGGLGLSAFMGWAPMVGTVPFSIVASLIMGYILRNNKDRADTVIGVMWAVGMAIGIILIDLKPGYFVDLMSYLFGSIMAVSSGSLFWMVLLNLGIIISVVVLYKEILGMSYDEEFAAISGIPVKLLYYVILVMVAFTIVMLIKAVGLILVIALFTIPASIAGMFTNDLKRMMMFSVLLSALFTTGGLILAYYLNLTAGATIILFACAGFGIAYAGKRINASKAE